MLLRMPMLKQKRFIMNIKDQAARLTTLANTIEQNGSVWWIHSGTATCEFYEYLEDFLKGDYKDDFTVVHAEGLQNEDEVEPTPMYHFVRWHSAEKFKKFLLAVYCDADQVDEHYTYSSTEEEFAELVAKSKATIASGKPDKHGFISFDITDNWINML